MIKRLLLKAYNAFLKYRRESKWRKQTRYWRGVINEKNTLRIDENARYLILAPHADDEWIGCSQIIKKCKNAIVLNMDMPGGDTNEMHQIRYREMSTLVSKYNKTLLTVGQDKVGSLRGYIDEEKPDYICLPFFFDWHPEHIQVMQHLREALLGVPYDGKVMMYQVSLPLHPDVINCSVPLNKKDFMEKWNVFEEIYKTQTKIAYKRFMANEQINGALDGSYASEVYCVMNKEEWERNIDVCVLTEKEVDEVKVSFQDITYVRNQIDMLLKKRGIIKTNE